jgi:hypothetical protein
VEERFGTGISVGGCGGLGRGPLVVAKDELMWPVGRLEGVVEFEGMERKIDRIAIVESAV